jgi:hypothetical protein
LSLRRQCVSSFEHFYKASQVTCKNARWIDSFSIPTSFCFDISIYVKECTAKNGGNNGDYSNKYLHSPTHLLKYVVDKQFDSNGEWIWGLKVRQGYFIPAWAVIVEYMGKMVKGKEE